MISVAFQDRSYLNSEVSEIFKSNDMRKYLMLIVILLFFYSLAVILRITTGSVFYLMNFIIIGSCIGLGVGLWPVFKRKKKYIARLISQLTVGGYMFFGLGCGLIYIFFGHMTPEDMQLEGFFLWLFSGVFAAGVLHYLVAKIIGPLIFNRAWCGWTCWTASLLDLLPWKKSPGRRSKNLEYVRYIHFFLSLVLIGIIFFGFNHNLNDNAGTVKLDEKVIPHFREYSSVFRIPEFWWFIIGNAFYYLAGIIMAIVLKDNRAFCKYLCPIVVFFKIGARFSLLKVKKINNSCNNCLVCEKNCPMDIRITEYLNSEQRVSSTECIVCQTCISSCPGKVLGLSFGIDFGRGEYLNRIKTGERTLKIVNPGVAVLAKNDSGKTA